MSSTSAWIWSEEHRDYYRYDSATKEYIWARNNLSQSEASRTDTSASEPRKITTTSTKQNETEDIEMTEEDDEEDSDDDEAETVKSRSPTVAPKERSLHGRSTPSHSLSPTHSTSPFPSPNVLEQPQSTQLPPGWVAQWHSTSNKHYYVNASTGETQWTYPKPASTNAMAGTTPTQTSNPYGGFKDKTTELPGLSGARTSSLGVYSLDTLLSGGTDKSKKGVGSERPTDQPISPLLGGGAKSPITQGLGSDTRSELADSFSGRTKNDISGHRSGGGRSDSLIGSAQAGGIESPIGYLPSSGIVPGRAESSRFEEEKKPVSGYAKRADSSVIPPSISSAEKRTDYPKAHNYPPPGGYQNYVATPSQPSYRQRGQDPQRQSGVYPLRNEPYRNPTIPGQPPGPYTRDPYPYEQPSGTPLYQGYSNPSAYPRTTPGTSNTQNAYESQPRPQAPYGFEAGYGGPAPPNHGLR
ncbi:hypothetical protein P154DRAFT_537707 [Amniculicola lignicola CBS 123094]|uniref:WW domain-containing protein n=1 Tax=Amniculicola lignicola CBS 123094 TaxID=1392246 RepID=A0A6A5W9F4_9PLEO|nr:hypothetical protein P154DRAFT_537707 [Amniculicola lignicola CBS 123094]